MNGGGIEAVIMNYFRYLDREKIQFDFIVCADSTHVPGEEIRRLGGNIITVPPYGSLLAYLKKLKEVFKNGEYSIVHVNMNTLSVFPLLSAWAARVPIRINHSHSTAHRGEGMRALPKYALRPFAKVFATDYMACSRRAGKWLFGQKLMDTGTVNVIPNAIETERFQYDEKARAEIRKQLGVQDAFVVGHVGRFAPQKNHSFLIECFYRLKRTESDAVLLLVGDGPLFDRIQKKVTDLGLEDSVIFLGQREDVNVLYQAMDVFVLPSLYEGLPLVGVEAQAAGLPCLFSDQVTDEAVIIGDTQLLSLSRSAREWADRIIRTRNYQRKSQTELTRLKEFDIRISAKDLGKRYEQMVRKRR